MDNNITYNGLITSLPNKLTVFPAQKYYTIKFTDKDVEEWEGKEVKKGIEVRNVRANATRWEYAAAQNSAAQPSPLELLPANPMPIPPACSTPSVDTVNTKLTDERMSDGKIKI